MNLRCAAVRRVLPSYVDRPLPAMLRGHSAGCLRCQAEAVAYRALCRDLARLGGDTVTAPAGIAVAGELGVVEHPGAGHRRPERHLRWPVVAGATGVAVAVGGAVSLLVRHRSRLAA